MSKIRNSKSEILNKFQCFNVLNIRDLSIVSSFESRVSNLIFQFKIILFSVGLSLLLVISGCCSNCLIARSEMAGQKDLEQTGSSSRTTELWAGNIDSIISSEYGGNLQLFTVDEVSPLIQLPGYYNSDLLMSCDSGRQIGIKDVVQYDSGKKAIVKVTSSLTKPALKLEKTYKMNFDTGDIYVTKEVKNLSALPVTIDSIQKMTLIKGGFFFIPINLSSRYQNLYKINDVSGNDITAQMSGKVIRLDNKIIYRVEQNSELSISADSSEGWFGYFYKDTLLLVKFSPFYTNIEKKDSLVFHADITKDAIICSFGETSRILPEKNSTLKIYTKLALIKLKDEINNIEDIEKALSYLKVNLIVRR